MYKQLIGKFCLLLPVLACAGVIDHTVSINAGDVRTHVVQEYDYVEHIACNGYGSIYICGHTAPTLTTRDAFVSRPNRTR